MFDSQHNWETHKSASIVTMVTPIVTMTPSVWLNHKRSELLVGNYKRVFTNSVYVTHIGNYLDLPQRRQVYNFRRFKYFGM